MVGRKLSVSSRAISSFVMFRNAALGSPSGSCPSDTIVHSGGHLTTTCTYVNNTGAAIDRKILGGSTPLVMMGRPRSSAAR